MAGIIWRINAPSINLSGFLLSESPSGTNSKKRGMKPETTSWTWEEIINPLTGRRHTHRTERGRGRSNGLDRIEHINNGNWSFPINYYPLQFDYEHLQSVGWRGFECKSTIKTVLWIYPDIHSSAGCWLRLDRSDTPIRRPVIIVIVENEILPLECVCLALSTSILTPPGITCTKQRLQRRSCWLTGPVWLQIGRGTRDIKINDKIREQQSVLDNLN